MRRTVLAAGAAALAMGWPAAWADAQFTVPVSGTVQVQSGSGCGVNGDDPCNDTTSFTGSLLFVLPSAADGDYFSAGIAVSLLGADQPVSLVSDTDHASEVVIRDGRVIGFSVNGGLPGCWVLSAAYGDGVNRLYYDNLEPQSDYTIQATAGLVPEPSEAGLWAVALLAVALRGRRWLGRRRWPGRRPDRAQLDCPNRSVALGR